MMKGRPHRLRFFEILLIIFIIAFSPNLVSSQSPEPPIGSAAEEFKTHLPVITNPPPSAPPESASYYMETINPDFTYELGCAAGKDNIPVSIVVLFFWSTLV